MDKPQHETMNPGSSQSFDRVPENASVDSMELRHTLRLALDSAAPFAAKSPRSQQQLERLRQAYRLNPPAVLSQDQFLPIEAFKFRPLDCLALGMSEEMTCFRSSGTTAQDRSQSYFSRMGLQFYEEQAWRSFAAVLRLFFPNPENVPAFRLIPTTDLWPDSSLAHMLDSFGQHINIVYDPAGHQLKNLQQPVWVFGTAFHFVNLYDQGYRAALPAGSVIFETGGTKNQSRQLSRQELYQAISEMFSVSTNYIVSEYGMSELACQAYDFVSQPSGPELSLQDRYYRFPRWVDVSLQSSSGVQRSGFGALIVDDPLRIDTPWPIRTQDLVELDADGRFQLVGRVPASSLKGCSLRVEELTFEAGQTSQLEAKTVHWHAFVAEEVRQRCLGLYEPLNQILASETCRKLLADYFQSDLLATWTQQDLLQSFPSSADSFFAAACQASKMQPVAERWLFIGPSSHPIATLHPICMAAALGLKLYLRCSHRDFAFFDWLGQKLKTLGVSIKLLDESFRLNGPWSETDALMVFGSDETVCRIQNLTGQLVQGFGNHLAASVIMASELGSQATALIRDAFSMKQQGCRSSRLTFILHDATTHNIRSELLTITKAWPGLQALEEEKIALLQEKTRYDLLKQEYFYDGSSALLPINPFVEEKSASDYLSLCPYVLPLVMVEESKLIPFQKWLAQDHVIKSLSLSPAARSKVSLTKKESCHLGHANILPWNGTHEGRSLFFAGHAE